MITCLVGLSQFLSDVPLRLKLHSPTMSEETVIASPPTPTPETTEAAPPSPVPPPSSRPRISLSNGTRGGRGGKSMFGLVLGTLNKAKIESKEREASDAAKRRQLLEARLQAKLRSETAEVRKQEEVRKDKTLAVRKEEELGVKVSVYRLRRTRIPYLANFLCTSDVIPDEQAMEEEVEQNDPQSFAEILAKSKPPRSHPPPLYYLPKKLLPSQEAFIKKRKEKITVASTAEWSAFVTERNAGVTEIRELRERVNNAPVSARADENDKDERNRLPEENEGDAHMDVDVSGDKDAKETTSAPATTQATSEEKDKTGPGAAAMDVDTKQTSTQPENDNDDAVEY
ncbi:hypothetical protein J3R30DRAFT_3418961 [Lentinula aciculospora]|uniref:Pinin/SDK/MemA protein domain-containing protein n=1 Tax=Lentinula aciculospora TaxID=153920 RepID=A0A9W9ATD6_9AGAR|nr:hypothetical protein J3R30DRAFT_3418961 [Lentinula aciculospora]